MDQTQEQKIASFDDVPEVTQEKKESLEEKFTKERTVWKNKIEAWSNLFSNIEKIPELQVQLFSAQGQLADYKAKLGMFYSKMNNKFREKKSNTIKTISDSPVRHTAPEKAALLEGALKDDLFKMELISSHIDFIDAIYDTIKNMTYGVKYRVELSNKLEV